MSHMSMRHVSYTNDSCVYRLLARQDAQGEDMEEEISWAPAAVCAFRPGNSGAVRCCSVAVRCCKVLQCVGDVHCSGFASFV